MCNMLYSVYQGFSVSPWLAINGYPTSTPLTGNALQDLMEVLQLSRFKEKDCNKSEAPFLSVNSNGWNSGKII